MSGKRITQKVLDNGAVLTRTVGEPEGELTNFNVSLLTQPPTHKKATEFTVEMDGGLCLKLDGRRARTLREVLNRHFDAVECEKNFL